MTQELIDRVYTDARAAVARRDLDAAQRGRVLWQRMILARDRWLVRHGPTPFLDFIRLVMPDLIIAPHHRMIADAFRRIAAGQLRHLMIFLPPGHSKSLLASILAPAWLLGLEPSGRVLSASHTVDLVEDFGRAVRDLIASDGYRRLFPDVMIRPDVSAAGKWLTSRGGQYKALGVGSAAAGRRADLIGVIDDPISEQDAASSSRRQKVNEWYPYGFRSRVMPGTPICLMNTRWAEDDLAGDLLAQSKGRHRWEVISIPAILDAAAADSLNQWVEGDEARLSAGDVPFPQLWPADEMREIRSLMPPWAWSALYMQRPTREGGGLFKRDWWRPWPEGVPLPDLTYLLQVWDTAFEGPKNRGDFCACTTWGVFVDPFCDPRKQRYGVILLGRVNKRMTFPELREAAYEYWDKWDKADAGPVDQVLVEAKATGRPLIQELQRRGVPITAWHTERFSDGTEKGKFDRAHASSIVLWSGSVYYPADREWPMEVIQNCESFPHGEHDDLADTCITAWLWLRRSWHVHVTHDYEDEVVPSDEELESVLVRDRRRTMSRDAVPVIQ